MRLHLLLKEVSSFPFVSFLSDALATLSQVAFFFLLFSRLTNILSALPYATLIYILVVFTLTNLLVRELEGCATRCC